MKTLIKLLEAKNISMEAFEALDVEAKAAIFNELNEGNATAFKALEESVDSNSKEVTSALKELKDVRESQMKSLNAALIEQGLEIKKLTDAEKEEKTLKEKSILDSLKENEGTLNDIKSGDKGKRLSFKAVGTMLISGNISGGNVPVEQRIAGVDNLASRETMLLDLVSRGTATSNIISWVSAANQEGAAGGTAEGALKNQIDFDLVVASQTVVKRTAFIKISEEMLGDIDFMNSEINGELMRELMKDVENQVYQGDNTPPNMNGILTTASAFAAGTFALAVDNANEVDVLRVAFNQIALANQGAPTAVLMNPSDVTLLLLEKVSSTDKRYIMALQEIASNRSLDGVPIITSTLVTAGTYLVGNFPLATVYDRGDISIEVGRDSDDFTKNLVTVIAEWRGATVVKTNKRASFVTGTFATDITALETT